LSGGSDFTDLKRCRHFQIPEAAMEEAVPGKIAAWGITNEK